MIEQIKLFEWLDKLEQYLLGKKQWKCGVDWVCEYHPLLPYEMGYSFDCKCGGPGMPPLSNAKTRNDERKKIWNEISRQIKFGDLGGNGCDKNAERNGLILASNIIYNLGI